MARPIRNTPILTGKDAVDFIQAASKIPSEANRKEERNRVENNVKKLNFLLAKLPK